jgi:hypothetical protein
MSLLWGLFFAGLVGWTLWNFLLQPRIYGRRYGSTPTPKSSLSVDDGGGGRLLPRPSASSSTSSFGSRDGAVGNDSSSVLRARR